MSLKPFVRQLGFQPGVQLNTLADQTDGAVLDNSDQKIAVLARLTRGRIDRPFRTHKGNFLQKTGPAVSIRANALNEAKLQTYEALNNGTYEGVIMRLSASDAAKKFAVLNLGYGAVLEAEVTAGGVTDVNVTQGGSGYTTGQSIVFGPPGTGAVATVVATAGVITAVNVTAPGTGYTTAPTADVASAPVWTVSADEPEAGEYTAYFMHHDCHNDGIKFAVHADSTPVGGPAVATKIIKVRLYDADSNLLHEFEGSSDPAAKDDFGQTRYLPDIIAARTDAVTAYVADNFTINPNATCYGRSSDGKDKWPSSATLACFVEGSLLYSQSDYDRCLAALRNGNDGFGYMITGGTQSLTLIGKMANFAIEHNIHLGVDLGGNLDVAAAIAMMASLNFDSHYLHVYWAPLEANDPMNGGKAIWGTAGLNFGFRCARNARVNAKGFAPKNYPVAGKDWPLNRTGVRQLVRPEQQDLSDLAAAQINPVIHETFNGGAKYIFSDSLTSAKTRVSYKKLISVAEMSSTMDDAITMYAKELVQYPMKEFIRRMDKYLDKLLPAAVASDWLVPSKNLAGNAPFAFRVQPSEVKPADTVHIEYWTCYDGVARQVIVQQTLVN